MTTPAESSRYTAVAIALHWAIALAIIGMIPAGWYMGDLPDGAPGQEMLYQLHKSIGITVLILTIARIGWRLANPAPPLPEDMPALEKTASHLVHWAFYGLMLLMPLSGWVYVSTAYEFQVPTVIFGLVSWPHLPFMSGLQNETGHGIAEFVHSKLAWVAIAMIVLHVGGALKHEIMDEDGVLKRMIPRLFGRAAPPQAPARGAVSAFGAAFLAFAIVAGAPIVASAASGGADLASTGEVAANWAVDYEASEISFSGDHDGSAFTGTFRDWSADIAFDAEDVSAARAEVAVDTGSARTGNKLYDDSLKSAEWFNVSGFPAATVVLSDFAVTETGYTAIAALTIKEQTMEAPFAFTLDIEGDTASMDGEAVFGRTPLDLGLESDPGADWVGEDVTVAVHVEASRIN
ncbi:MAG: cytochrome b/b6 domain-containing protein [Pseudomonadota bacterium]